MKKSITPRPAMRFVLLFCLCVFLLFPQKAQAASYRLGARETVYSIQDTNIKGSGDKALTLAHKITIYYIGAGVYLHDDGYVLKVKGAEKSYYELPAAKIAKYQAAGLLPVPLPVYSISTWDYLAGYLLWIVMGPVLILLAVGWCIKMSKTKSSLSFTPRQVDVSSASQAVLVYAFLPLAAGVQSALASFASPSAGKTLSVAFNPSCRTAGSAAHGTYQSTLTVPKSAETGTWKLSAVSLIGTDGHSVTYAPKDLDKLPADLLVTSNNSSGR